MDLYKFLVCLLSVLIFTSVGFSQEGQDFSRDIFSGESFDNVGESEGTQNINIQDTPETFGQDETLEAKGTSEERNKLFSVAAVSLEGMTWTHDYEGAFNDSDKTPMETKMVKIGVDLRGKNKNFIIGARLGSGHFGVSEQFLAQMVASWKKQFSLVASEQTRTEVQVIDVQVNFDTLYTRGKVNHFSNLPGDIEGLAHQKGWLPNEFINSYGVEQVNPKAPNENFVPLTDDQIADLNPYAWTQYVVGRLSGDVTYTRAGTAVTSKGTFDYKVMFKIGAEAMFVSTPKDPSYIDQTSDDFITPGPHHYFEFVDASGFTKRESTYSFDSEDIQNHYRKLRADLLAGVGFQLGHGYPNFKLQYAIQPGLIARGSNLRRTDISFNIAPPISVFFSRENWRLRKQQDGLPGDQFVSNRLGAIFYLGTEATEHPGTARAGDI